jgi:sortase A
MNASEPGQPGNLVLAGHRTTDFLPLQRVANEDLVLLEWLGADRRLRSQRYRVDGLEVVEARDTRALRQTLEDRLTLITCYPFGRGARSPQRYVVRAAPV